MNYNPFMVVLLVVVVAIGAGYLFATSDQMVSRVDIANNAMNQSMAMVVTAQAQTTQVANAYSGLQAQNGELSRQLATQTANQNICEQEKRSLSDRATDALAGKKQAEDAAQIASTEMEAANSRLQNMTAMVNDQEKQIKTLMEENKALKNQLTMQQPTPAPVAADESQPIPITGMIEPALLPTLGIGLFSIVVFASYRMIKAEQLPVKKAHKFNTNTETVYVKMTRQAASRYARSRTKSGN
jgi:hypothetical protein